MEFNPFEEQFIAKQNQFRAFELERSDSAQVLSWHECFGVGAAAHAVRESERDVDRLRLECKGLRSTLREEEEREAQLVPVARLGFDPRRWFSAERQAFAADLDATRKRMTQLRDSVAEAEIQETSRLDVGRQKQKEIDRYRATDPLQLKAKLRAIDVQLDLLRAELAVVSAQKKKVDLLLQAPLQERQTLLDRLNRLQQELRRAQDLESQLSQASNSRDKALIHEECGRQFAGQSSPGRVIQRVMQEVQACKRNLDKVQERLQRLARTASRAIGALIVDGNNLCYQRDAFVGLAPLLALTDALAASYRVVVVFDASIRHMLQMSDRQIAFGFPREVRVHVVASKQAADETVLELASAADVYVISNDRFRDFTDKAAVLEQRLLRHEIVAGRVMVHDLQVSVVFNESASV